MCWESKFGGRILSTNIPQMQNGYPTNLKNRQQENLKSKIKMGDAVEKELAQSIQKLL